MGKWDKAYGIDDHGNRTIVITEAAPKSDSLEEGFRVIGRVFAYITIAGIALGAVAALIEMALGGIAGFLAGNRWLVAVIAALVGLYVIGRVARRAEAASSGSK